MSKNSLVVYWSQSGNTEKLAQFIHAEVGGTLAKVADNTDVAAFDTVFVGSPNYAATIVPEVKAYLEAKDLSGKTVVPFCTHGMGGLQNVAADITALCPNSTVLASFAIKGEEVASAPDKVKAWLSEIGVK
ncbi:MAG: hypothetical protein FWB97_02735 [Oscillospiraceae bacterium]|nr:hypothetical protein [Oscillospiraceae bacterium]